jgi:hypothetical protein
MDTTSRFAFIARMFKPSPTLRLYTKLLDIILLVDDIAASFSVPNCPRCTLFTPRDLHGVSVLREIIMVFDVDVPHVDADEHGHADTERGPSPRLPQN